MPAEKKFDVLILGAGPAGLSAAIGLADSGLSVAMIEKSEFPKNKTCGDGLTLDVVHQLRLLSPELEEAFMNFPLKFPVYGTGIFSPDFRNISIPSVCKGQSRPMYTCRRKDFDHFLFQYIRKFENIHIFKNTKALNVIQDEESISIHTVESDFTGKILIFADGASSLSSEIQGKKKRTKEHRTLGIRAYYKDIMPFNDNRYIEIYFIKDILPGYFWIFPLGNGLSNVGMGVKVSTLKERNISIKEKFEELIEREPLKQRFEKAICVEQAKGHLLPMAGKKESISGSRFIIAGDAAGLVDPFSGEGVGNAIRSGRVAAAHVKNCFTAADFSAGFNKAYDKELFRRLGKEFLIGRIMLQCCKSQGLLQFFIGTIGKNEKHLATFHKALEGYSSGEKGKGIYLILKLLYILTIQNIISSVKKNKS